MFCLELRRYGMAMASGLKLNFAVCEAGKGEAAQALVDFISQNLQGAKFRTITVYPHNVGFLFNFTVKRPEGH